LAKGDIGFHFPDTDPAYKDADSQQLLKQVIQQELPPYSIENLATTIILQRPKQRVHIDGIRENLAKLMNPLMNRSPSRQRLLRGCSTR